MSKTNLLAGWSSEREVAEALGKDVRTLREWRQRGDGPPWSKIGKTVIYRDAAIPAYFESLEKKLARRRGAA